MDRIRARLQTFVRGPLAVMPGRWAFALYHRQQPGDALLASRAVGVVTRTESVALTGALIRRLPARLWLERARTPVQLLPISNRPEMLYEAWPAVILRFEDGQLRGTKALAAHTLPPLGIVFLTELEHPPHGWPL